MKDTLLKIGDFGICRIADTNNKGNHTKGTGTPLYNSYEILKGIDYS